MRASHFLHYEGTTDDPIAFRDAFRDRFGAELAGLPGVTSVHDLHVWTIGNREISLSSHLVCPPGGNPNRVLQAVQSVLQERFSIRHSTVQIEIRDGNDPDCDGACDPPLGQASALA